MLYLVGGGALPWEDATSDSEILSAKKTIDFAALTVEMGCAEVGRWIGAARALRPEERPDYDSFRALLCALEDCPSRRDRKAHMTPRGGELKGGRAVRTRRLGVHRDHEGEGLSSQGPETSGKKKVAGVHT